MWTSEKTWKVLKGAAIAGVGAGLAYLTAYLGDLDLGAWGPAVAAVLAVVAMPCGRHWRSLKWMIPTQTIRECDRAKSNYQA